MEIPKVEIDEIEIATVVNAEVAAEVEGVVKIDRRTIRTAPHRWLANCKYYKQKQIAQHILEIITDHNDNLQSVNIAILFLLVGTAYTSTEREVINVYNYVNNSQLKHLKSWKHCPQKHCQHKFKHVVYV